MVKKVKTSKLPLMIIAVVVIIFVFFAAKYLDKNSKKTDFPTVNQEMGSIIKGFPDFPMYPNAKVESSQITGAYGTQPVSYQAYLESTDDVSKIIKWYLEATKAADWDIDRAVDTSQADDQNFIVKKGLTKATINVEQEGASSFISIYIQ